MSLFYAHDCNRCSAKYTVFDLKHSSNISFISKDSNLYHIEVFAVCRNCRRASIFFVIFMAEAAIEATVQYIHSEIERPLGDLDPVFVGEITPADISVAKCPDHTPPNVRRAFDEAAKCVAISCPNAAGAMFRLCLETMIKEKYPSLSGRTLYLKLEQLVEEGRLPVGSEDLVSSIRVLDNDAAHEGDLTMEDAEDLLEFTQIALGRIYSEPARVLGAQGRRRERRQK